MIVTNSKKLLAREADLIKFMNYYQPGRLFQVRENEWRDFEHKDISIWKNASTNQYRFKEHSPKTIELNKIINGKTINGYDSIAYIRRFYRDIFELTCGYEPTKEFEITVNLLAEFHESNEDMPELSQEEFEAQFAEYRENFSQK